MKKIIIVEDDDAILDTLCMILRPPDYEVVCFSNGDQVMENCYDMPHLFILDKQLAGVDGLELCRHIKNNNSTKHVPVIIMSASPGISTLAADAGADDVLVKPYTLRTLRAIVAKYTS